MAPHGCPLSFLGYMCPDVATMRCCFSFRDCRPDTLKSGKFTVCVPQSSTQDLSHYNLFISIIMQASSFKDVVFRATDLPLMDVVESLRSGQGDLIYAKPVRERNPDRWNVCPGDVLLRIQYANISPGFQCENGETGYLQSCLCLGMGFPD
jgi:hypothetical protein